MVQIRWMDKISNEEVLAVESKQDENCVRKHRWIQHVLRHDELLCNLTEERMVGKPTRGRRKLQMLEDLYENNSYEVVKRTAEDRKDTSARRDCTRKKVIGLHTKKSNVHIKKM